jgi:hypothetical protein
MNLATLKKQEGNSNEDLDVIILETIDEVLSLLGESPKAQIFYYLLRDFGINRKEIPNNLADFSSALRKLLGVGAKLLEINFMKKLNTKIKAVQERSEPDWLVPELTFESYVKLKKRRIQQTKEICEMETLFIVAETENIYT